MSEVVIDNLGKHYGAVRALDDVSLHVAEGEFVTLLGPSGCGKSTTLFALAGLDRPTEGTIRIGDRVFFDAAAGIDVPAERRGIGLVFQSYALWPHMTVRQNLAFPLKLRKVPKAEQAVRIEEALALVDLTGLGERLPHELSGGQQQRVALARTLVFRPSLLLLDEPLSNLDAKLRHKARDWLKQLQRQLGLTTLYVTHDQEEALAMSDRIAVMQAGRIVQLDTPERIYRRPATRFVADFIGAGNFLPVRHVGHDEGGRMLVETGEGVRLVTAGTAPPGAGADLAVTIRPQHLRLSAAPIDDENRLTGTIVDRTYLGARHGYTVAIGDQRIQAESEQLFEPGAVHLAFRAEDTLLLDG
ncbi:ABC transporter ATP-binding protein [Sphingomonas colocasiae]|uniref:ABC transporter ATP-binding protein n=1 Tax=Sphingomonas colocasiae TaxID=1848973 RepID=A0ABS7PSA1_9SPHN|nr:ABC transporter ATP-binding protein [Sphingomonas colocasiae]MBY8824215.1 ABC transporter ATP-binding protein [Sphingomonas colocasiae]